MSWIRRLDLIDPYYTTCSPPPLVVRETSIVKPSSSFFPSFIHDEDDVEDLAFPFALSPPDLFEDLVQIEKSPSSCKYYQLVRRRVVEEYPLQYLCHRVSELETKFDRLVGGGRGDDSDRKYKLTKEIKGSGERKYKWEAEVQERKYKWEAEFDGPAGDRKYTWTTEIKGVNGKKKKKDVAALKKAKADAEAAEEKKKKEMAAKKKKKSYNWTTELKSERENGEMQHTYTIKASTGGADKEKEKVKKIKKKEKPRVVVIEQIHLLFHR